MNSFVATMGVQYSTTEDYRPTSAGDECNSVIMHKEDLSNEKSAKFLINGKPYQVSDLAADTSLNSFIREHAHFRGTKFMCLEGGCGSCVVAATVKLPDGKTSTFAVNSCLVPIYACHNWAIETVEALGNRRKGYGKVQAALASQNGTQCGYCSPGMVMNMYSLLKGKSGLTMKEVENSFGGNICRCTGYRPILDAFKSFASDAPKELKELTADLEEISNLCPRTNEPCGMTCGGKCFDINSFNSALLEKQFRLKLSDGKNWYRISEKREIFEIFDMIDDYSYMLIGGKTSHGVYRVHDIINYIDINGVSELHSKNISGDSIILGANVTLTSAMEFFYDAAKRYSDKFGYTKMLADHIDLIANVPVRNTGTLAGNLSIKHKYKEFPSDIFVILEGVGAQLTIEDVSGIETNLSLLEYLITDMNKKAITKITLPALDISSYVFKSYKIMPRAQNAHAYVNAAFLFKVNKNDKFRVLETPRIIFGGITSKFIHAEATESFLNGKQLLNDNSVKEALNILSSELKPDYLPPDASAEYKKGLAVSLLYKFILSLSPESISQKNRNGGNLLDRPLSSGKQGFDTDKNLWPLNKPIPKLEAYSQCSGEAEYVNDIKKIPGELFAAVVVSKKATASSFKLDPSNALKISGVVAFYSAKDIPGDNDFMSPKIIPEMGFKGEEVFADKSIKFAGQALGVIVAETHDLALDAAEKVKVEYFGVQKPWVDFVDVIKADVPGRIIEQAKLSPVEQKDDIKYTVSGKMLIKGQYHYSMETQSCLCVPTEDGLDVYPSSQWPAAAQGTISLVLKIPENSINVSVRRLGGAYGCKISRNQQVSAICSIASYLTQRPVRLTLSLETNMQMIGKRFPCYFDYKAEVNDVGQIQRLTAKLYQDVGLTLNECCVGSVIEFLSNTYDVKRWSVVGYSVQTDTPSNTWARAPGSTEAACCVETVMEHIASVVKKDPVSVKLVNMVADHNPLIKMVNDLKLSSDYDKRLASITAFNNESRWKKRGMCLTPLNYPLDYFGRYHATVSVFGNDGTVAVSHGGIECGQGLNTKVAQACAHLLGIPLEFVKIMPTVNFISPNNATTGGSQTSEAVVYAVIQACKEILKRLEPTKAKLPSGSQWVDIVRKAASEDVDLKASYMYKSADVKSYNIYAAAVSEVEIDVLTGQMLISRVDIIEDAGQSLSPQVDVGQVEGAFVMGLGYYLTEQLVYDKETGKLLTDRTWNYKPPGAKDIPINFQVQLLRNSLNPLGVLRSKATGEPPFNLSCSVVFAIINALKSARKDCGKVEDWFEIDYPMTPEQIWLLGSTDIKAMTL